MDMQIKPGIVISSTETLRDTVFEDAIIFISEHNAHGTIGFIINRKFERTLNELEEFRNSISIPLYDGGPVDKEHLFFIHRRPDIIHEGTLVSNEIYVGGNFSQAVKALNEGVISLGDIKIFIGYCGWDAGELDNEIGEGSWNIIDSEETFIDLFSL
jgi:putative transcriptional regulator